MFKLHVAETISHAIFLKTFDWHIYETYVNLTLLFQYFIRSNQRTDFVAFLSLIYICRHRLSFYLNIKKTGLGKHQVIYRCKETSYYVIVHIVFLLDRWFL